MGKTTLGGDVGVADGEHCMVDMLCAKCDSRIRRGRGRIEVPRIFSSDNEGGRDGGGRGS